ncbi:hypothetical protein F7731_07200 [Cytobacillus depressus]|uniref:Lipoprotein n=1 Tax=Cytobacillus depressus TaxID=1602942 RepID=A0A6L3VDS6_9BACI|nr:hypothetical protein [Cytobacillus depressus]KAB2337391.1 hypothetical protein F7731_07200 [Cytobacillus depressus]
MKRIVYLYIVFLLFAAGCQTNKPKPETKMLIKPVNISQEENAVPVTTKMDNKDLFYVNHQVQGKNVLIECMVHGVTFRDTNSSNKGKIILYVDGKKKEEISSAAFIVKGLSAGTHRIKLEVMKKNNRAPIMQKEFYVSIP